jgi:hypothetical protein
MILVTVLLVGFYLHHVWSVQEAERRADDDRARQHEWLAADLMKNDHITREQAEAQLAPIQMSDEDNRRFEFEREQKQKDLQTLHASTCKAAPYLDECR